MKDQLSKFWNHISGIIPPTHPPSPPTRDPEMPKDAYFWEHFEAFCEDKEHKPKIDRWLAHTHDAGLDRKIGVVSNAIHIARGVAIIEFLAAQRDTLQVHLHGKFSQACEFVSLLEQKASYNIRCLDDLRAYLRSFYRGS